VGLGLEPEFHYRADHQTRFRSTITGWWCLCERSLSLVRREVTVEGAFTYSEYFCYITDRVALVAHSGCLSLLGDRERGWASADFSSLAGCGEAGVCAFSEELTLEAGECAEYVEDEFSTSGSGVDLFGHGRERHSPGFEVCDELDEMREISAESIESPDSEYVARQQVSVYTLT
jgi:hypothetical protein